MLQPCLPTQVRRLAVVCPSWVGDCVMATPVLRAVRRHCLDAKVLAFVRPGLQEVLAGLPWVDELVVCDTRGLSGPWRLGQAIRRARVEAVLLLPNSFKTALATALSRTRIRIGYNRDGRGWLLTNAIDALQQRSTPIAMVEYYARLIEIASARPSIDRRLELAVTAEERAAADRLLHDVKSPFALLNPGANRPEKRWPAERFAEVADQLASTHGLAVVVNGSPGERAVIDDLLRHARCSIVDLSIRGVTLGALKAVISQASIVVTNDTGPRHIAAALGTPAVVMFGPTDHRWTTLHSARERLLLAEPFLPEECVADQHPQACAIEKISVGDVLAAVRELLAL